MVSQSLGASRAGLEVIHNYALVPAEYDVTGAGEEWGETCDGFSFLFPAVGA